MKILFCRHGESTENARGNKATVMNDAPLTKRGLKQTYSFIPIFKKYNVEKVYYSPKERAKKIGQVINKRLKIPHEVIPELTERNWGKWGTKPWKEVSEMLSRFPIRKRYEIIPPKGESWKQFEKRLLKAIKRIETEAEKKGYETIAIVMHRGNFRALFPALLNKELINHERFSVEIGSISIVSKISSLHYYLEVLNLVPRRGISRLLGVFKKGKKIDY